MNRSRPFAKKRSNSSNSSGSNQNKKRPNTDRRKSGRKKSDLDPQLLVKKASGDAVIEYKSDRKFDDLPIHSSLKSALKQKGFERPTEIQDKSLETLLEGRDILGIAQTGTGKTGAFLIPIIQNLIQDPKRSFALIMVPTRELATQVEDEFKSMSKGLRLSSSCFIGGTNINSDLRVARQQTNVLIATPGRLLDLVNRKAVDLRFFHTLVLDEFDRMLDMGFIHDVRKIVHAMSKRQHNMLFSATLDNKQKKIIEEILKNPVTVKVSTGQTTNDNIDQDIIRVGPGEDKFQILLGMLENPEMEKVLIFEETKHKASRLCEKLNKKGIASEQIHGNKSQNARQRALDAFKKGLVRTLVATDVAARGIDVSDITHVINFEVPQTFDSYIHRIGRTGRAGKVGKAFTFVD